jgi:hypothetical protein
VSQSQQITWRLSSARHLESLTANTAPSLIQAEQTVRQTNTCPNPLLSISGLESLARFAPAVIFLVTIFSSSVPC